MSVADPEPTGSRPAPVRPHLVEPWPHGVSREPTMRISDVLAELGADFPALTHSKLRFLEEQGLVEPRRSPGGYRQYSRADVERLRFVLRLQRDRYLPLRVIGEQLAALDGGTAEQVLAPHLVADAPRRYTAATLAAETDAPADLIEELVAAGLLRADDGGHLAPGAREIAEVARALAEHGVQARHLRAFHAAVERELALVDQVVAPLRGQRAVAGSEQAAALATELAELFGRLHLALLRAGVEHLRG